MNILNIAATLCIGLLTGAELTVSVFVNPLLGRLNAAAQTELIRLFARRFGAAMPFWYSASLLLLLAETIVRRHQPGIVFLAAATAIWAAAIVFSLTSLVPINNRLARMDVETFTGGAWREHGRWDTLHRVRVAALGVAMVAFLAGIGV